MGDSQWSKWGGVIVLVGNGAGTDTACVDLDQESGRVIRWAGETDGGVHSACQDALHGGVSWLCAWSFQPHKWTSEQLLNLSDAVCGHNVRITTLIACHSVICAVACGLQNYLKMWPCLDACLSIHSCIIYTVLQKLERNSLIYWLAYLCSLLQITSAPFNTHATHIILLNIPKTHSVTGQLSNLL